MTGFEKTKKSFMLKTAAAAETPTELSAKLKTKQANAAHRREIQMHERQFKLRRTNRHKQYTVMIHEHELKLQSIRLQAKLEYAMTAATVRREVLLRRQVEKYSAQVEYAQNVALLQKFKRLSMLKKSLADSLSQMKDVDLDESEAAIFSKLQADANVLLEKAEELKPEYFESDSTFSMAYHSPSAISLSTTDTPVLSSARTATHATAPIRQEFMSALLHPQSLEFPRYISLSDSILESKVLPVSTFTHLDELSYLDLVPLLPSVTRFSLRELDIDEIITSAKVRHDLYFDPNLQFKANLEGEKGKDKLDKTNEYWSELKTELDAGEYYRVPLILFESKKILEELLPKTAGADQEVAEWLDCELIAQQIEHQIFNPVTLISTLTELLKRHCAPARDAMVDSMLEACSRGEFVETLKILFNVLEIMKLVTFHLHMKP
jgi:hypothetical protein